MNDEGSSRAADRRAAPHPQRMEPRHLGGARAGERVGGVACSRMAGARLEGEGDAQAGGLEEARQGVRRPQPEPLRQVGDHEPRLTPSTRWSAEACHEPRQHLPAGIVDGPIERPVGRRRDPGRVRHHEIGSALREQVSLDDLDGGGQAEAGGVVAGAGDRARLEVGRDHARASAREQQREDPGARADVEGGAPGQGSASG